MRIQKIFFGVLVVLVTLTQGWGASYELKSSIDASNLPSCGGGGSWSKSGSTFTCSGTVSLVSGDTITADGDYTLSVTNGITLAGNNTIGSAANTIKLYSQNGGVTINGSGNTVYGDVEGVAQGVAVSGATINGNVKSTNNSITISNSSINGNIFSNGGSGITLANSTVRGDVESDNVTVTTSGGSIVGNIKAGGSGLVANNTNITATTINVPNNTVKITGGTISGAITTSGGNGVELTNVTMISGSITTNNVGVTISGSSVGSSSSIITISSGNVVRVQNSSTVYANITAPDWSSSNPTIIKDQTSVIYGTCNPNYGNPCEEAFIPIADYHMDECSWNGSSGEVRDSSGNNLNATAKSGAETVFDSRMCRSGYLDSKQYIEVPDNEKLRFTNSFTISAWIKTSKATGTIVSKTDLNSPWVGFVFAIGPDSGGKLAFWNGSAHNWYVSKGPAVNDNQWHHVTMTVSGQTLKFYVDGTQNGSDLTMSHPMSTASSSPMRIGFENNLDSNAQKRYFSGSIDELKIWNVSLSSSEINEIYNNEKNGKNYDGSSRSCNVCPPPAPIADYHMDECSWNGGSGEVRDSSGNNNHATATGVTTEDGKLCKSADYPNLDGSHYIKTNQKISRGGSKEVTVMGWIYVYGHTGEWVNIWHLTPNDSDCCVDKNSRQPALWLHKDNNTRLHATNDTQTQANIGIYMSNGSIAYGKWHHVVQVVTTKQMRLYIDGKLTDTYDSNSDFLFNDGYFYIGDRWYRKNHEIDEVKIFKKALSSDRINEIYNNEKNLKNYDGAARTCNNCKTGPALKWTFSECTVGQDIKSVRDYSGSGNDGTVTGEVKCVNYPKNTDDNKGALFTQSRGRQYVTSNKNLHFTYQSGYTVITRFKFEDTPYRSWLMYFGYDNNTLCNNNGMHWLINSHPETPQCETRLPDSKTQVGAFCGPQNSFDLKQFEGKDEINVTTVYYKNYTGDNGQNPRRLRSYLNGNLVSENNLTASQSDPSSGNAPVFLAKQWGKCGNESDFKGVVDHLEIYPYSIDYDNKCLVLSSSFDPSSVGGNEESQYTLSVRNVCDVPVGDVSFNLSWPSNLTLSNGPNISSGGWSSRSDGGNWYGINIAAGSTETFSAKFKSGVAGEYIVTATPTQSTPTYAKLTVGTAEFKAWEKDGSYSNAKIYTKVAGQSISSTGYPIYVGDANNNDFNGTVCVRVADSAHSSESWYKKLLNGKSVAFENIGSVSWASKNAWLEIKAKLNGDVECNTITGDVSKSDSFAIKPDNFTASTSPNPAKAGESFTLNVSNSTSGYTGDANITTATYKQSCATKSGFLTVSEPLPLSFSTAPQPQNLISKEVGDINISIKDSTWTAVDQYADCIKDSNLNTPDTSGKVGCDIETNATIKVIPYDINASNTTAEPIWAYKSFKSEPKLSFAFEVNATRPPVGGETGAQLLSNYSSECFAQDTTVVMEASLTPATKSLTNSGDINITTQDLGVNITPSVGSLSVVVPTTKFSGGKADVTLQINSEKGDISTPDDVLKMSISGWTSNIASNTYDKISNTTNMYFLYGRIAMPSQMVDHASSATVRAYAQVYATSSSALPSGGNWVQAPGSSTWWINRLHDSSSGSIAAVLPRASSKLSDDNTTDTYAGITSSVASNIFGGVGQIGLSMNNTANKDQKITLHFAVPEYLWYGSKAYSYDPNTDCSQHPCGTVDIFGTSDTAWFGSGDNKGDKTIKTVPKGKRVPKINW